MHEPQNTSATNAIQAPLLLRLQQVAELTAMGPSTILAWEKTGKFPKAVRLSPGKRVWLSSDVKDWVYLQASHEPAQSN
jgi:predicted DNA-binding transcriptional regulator AlpA